MVVHAGQKMCRAPVNQATGESDFICSLAIVDHYMDMSISDLVVMDKKPSDQSEYEKAFWF